MRHPFEFPPIPHCLALGVGLCMAWGCAGPNTPLGAVSSLQNPKGPIPPQNQVFKAEILRGAQVDFLPKRQVLHRPAPLELVIRDKAQTPEETRLLIRYNQLDVTRNFLQSAQVTNDPEKHEMKIRVPKVTLGARETHEIEVFYSNPQGIVASNHLDPPTCRAFRIKNILHTGTFSPPRSYVREAEKRSKEMGFSPAFFVGLIAQESSFDPQAVSWAKAVGLTQITPIADQEVRKFHEQWPRFPGAHRMSPVRLRYLVRRGVIRPKNEWRLDPRRSLQGGLTYLRYLAEAWSTPKNLKFLRANFQDPETEHTKLILASYHTGYSTVRKALLKNGAHWMEDPRVQEASYYVNRIFSYCYHFSETPKVALR